MRTLGLRTKLVLTFTGLFLAFTLVFAWYLIERQGTIASQALETRAVGLSTILAKLIAPAVDLDLDKSQAENSLAAIKGHKDLIYVVVLKADGSVYLRYSEVNLPAGSELLQTSQSTRVELRGELMHVLEPIRSNGKDIGTLVAGFSRQSINQEIRTSTRTVLSFSGVILLIGFLVAWVISGTIARPLLELAAQLTRLSRDLAGLARSQETSSTQQVAAIDETRGTMEVMLASAQQIAESSSAVLGNAERTVTGNRDVAHRIQELNGHAERVAEILAVIMQVADRTDLLALNAALEGTKAGEAGRGFTLVAAEMRRLAESVMESVAGIRRLMNDMRSASHSAVQAGQEGIALSEEATRSARDIALVTQQQRKATEQVGRSMDDMAATVSEAMSSTRQTAATAEDLVHAALHLDRMVGSRGTSGTSGIVQSHGDRAAHGTSARSSDGRRALPGD
ncbi:MAG TPA: methyl-accepting chemotaxis protein [Polyangia bacterium]